MARLYRAGYLLTVNPPATARWGHMAALAMFEIGRRFLIRRSRLQIRAAFRLTLRRAIHLTVPRIGPLTFSSRVIRKVTFVSNEFIPYVIGNREWYIVGNKCLSRHERANNNPL